MLVAIREKPKKKHIIVSFGSKFSKESNWLRDVFHDTHVDWEFWPERNNINPYDERYWTA